MPEREFVEIPFLQQLQSLGWQVIDQGSGIPADPAQSRRDSFRELVLPQVFRNSVRSINTLPDGRTWLTDRQLDALYQELTTLPGSLVEANKAVQELLYKQTVDANEVTGEQYPTVQLIDFARPERNHFLAINQFRIDTPGRVKDYIIPDIVLFVNGIPLAVVECKDVNEYTANPMFEAYTQLRRYSDQREETKLAGLSEGEPGLFHFNQFNIITCGSEARFGSITATEEYFYPWRDIYPVVYKNYAPPLEIEREQEVLIQGMLPPATLLDIVRNFVLYMDPAGNRYKIVCRYQQYRAVGKILERLRGGETPDDRSGVVWHTQGSGKSLMMVFTVRKLRRSPDLKDFKVVVVNDRRDLEKQIRETLVLAGEPVRHIDRSDRLGTLGSEASNLNAVMVHKFQEFDESDDPDYLAKALPRIPRHDTFGVINDSDRILLMVDEAHPTQGGQLGENLFDAFPNAVRLAYTGTPLVSDRYKMQGQLTKQRFGPYIDIYTLKDSVADGATVSIMYEGKTVYVSIKDSDHFERRFDDLCRNLSPE